MKGSNIIKKYSLALEISMQPTCIAWRTGATAEAAWQVDALIETGIYSRSTLVKIAITRTRTRRRCIGISPCPALVTNAYKARCIFVRQACAMAAAQLRRLTGQTGVLPQPTMGTRVSWPANAAKIMVEYWLVK